MTGRDDGGGDGLPRSSKSHTLALPLQRKHLPAHLQHGLEALPSANGVLPEALDGDLLDRVLDLLPAAAQRDDLGRLVELRAGIRRRGRGPVDDGLAHREQVRPGHVCAAHGDFLGLGVHVGRLVDVGGFLAAEERV